jgi:PqqD family protein of HPr-rel-A system
MAGPRYIADPPDARRSVELEGLTALYHRPSGMTHILAPPAPQLLDALGDGEANPDELLARVRERFDIEGGVEALEARLAELEAAGLIRRA